MSKAPKRSLRMGCGESLGGGKSRAGNKASHSERPRGRQPVTPERPQRRRGRSG